MTDQKQPTLTMYPGLVLTYRGDVEPSHKVYERCPELDAFMIDEEYVTREVFEARAREIGWLK